MVELNAIKKDVFISIILIAKDFSNVGFSKSISELYHYLDVNFTDYEIVIVEDVPALIGRTELNKLLKEVPSIRFIELSYKVDYEVAVTVGLENSIGDYVFIFNVLQDPIEVIVPMFEECYKNNIDVVIGVARNKRKSLGYKFVRPFVGLILSEIGYDIPKDSTTLRCLSRTAVNSATKARNFHHQIFVRISQCGLGVATFAYLMKNIKGNKRKLFGSIKSALDLLVFNSTKPLRWMTALGFLGSFFTLVFASYSFITRLIYNDVVEGWSSTVILVSLLFMLLFIILSFFGEYLARLLNEQSKHEPYWIINEKQSTVMVDINRYNVSNESVKN